jgi:hypothetical protein
MDLYEAGGRRSARRSEPAGEEEKEEVIDSRGEAACRLRSATLMRKTLP